MTAPEVSPAVHGRGERKQITAVFIDVVGFSDIASTADAEDLEAWLEDYYRQSRKIIEAHDGEVTEYLGDGVVALFGLAKADELAAAKAVNAAVQAINDINAGYQGGIDVQLRAGVATGEVAVRAAAGTLPRATGMVTTLAQRIQTRAAPGTVMIAESTRNLLRGTIALTAVPDQKLKGFAEAQTLYQPIPSTAPMPEDEGPSFFVGRTAEQKRIADSDRPCLVIGQAGIGKTALSRQVAKGATAVATFSADGVHTRASYQPFKDWIMGRIGSTLPEFADIQSHFPTLDLDAQRALALALGLDEGQRLLAEKSNVALKALIENSIWEAIRAAQPCGLLLFEDLHWLDNASFGVVVAILTSPQAADYQILMTSREDTKIGKYLGYLAINMIPLDKLDDTDASLMLDALSKGDVAAEERATLVEKAAGVPLFLEQLFKRSLAGEAEKSDSIPGSLMDLLAEQIDATGSAKPVLQCGAVIGRSFDLGMLRSIASDNEPLEPHLAKACDRGVLQKDGDKAWTFSHALLHQAAYQGLLRRTRIAYHSQVAAHLQEHHADAVRRNPALLTDHLTLSQQHVPAIQNYLAVSQWALFQGAFDDAEAHILAALSLCSDAPDDVDVTDLEIACHTALGSIRVQTLGFTSDPAKEAFEEVERLASTKSKYSAANCPAFYGSFSHAILSGDKAGATRFGNLFLETLDNAPDADDDGEIRIGCLNVQVALNFYSGNFQQQFKDFAALREIYDITRHGAMITNYGVDIFAAAQMFEPVGRAICGETHLVEPLSAETDAHQIKLNIPVMMPYAQIWGAVPLYYAGQHDVALARVIKGIETAHSQTAAFWQVTGAAWLNVMDPSQSETAEGLAGFETVIKTHEMIGANIGLPYFRAHYATALARHDRLEDAYQSSYLAVRECEASGLHCWFAEVQRLHADICRKSGRRDECAIHLKRAIDVARRQTALLWQMRALLDQNALGIDNRAAIAELVAIFPAIAPPPELAQAQRILDA